MLSLPASIVSILQPFSCLFTHPTWLHVQVLLAGTLLAQGPRTVTGALRAMGLSAERRFERYHRVLNRARWSSRQGARILLGLLIEMLPAQWPLVIAVDETLERRKGARIRAKGRYRDAVRSSQSKVVTCLGLEWICMALLIPVPWSARPWALPFLTRLAPSKRANTAAGRRHRTVVELTIGLVWLVARWLKLRRWVLLGDGSYSCVQLGWEVLAAQATLITRLRLDARLFTFPEPVPPGRRGPKPKKGTALAKLNTRVVEARVHGEEVTIAWYGHPKTLRLLSEVCLWHTPGWPPLPIRWVLVLDPEGRLPTQAFFTTDLCMVPARVVELVDRLTRATLSGAARYRCDEGNGLATARCASPATVPELVGVEQAVTLVENSFSPLVAGALTAAVQQPTGSMKTIPPAHNRPGGSPCRSQPARFFRSR